jgi:hypothetical protein
MGTEISVGATFSESILARQTSKHSTPRIILQKKETTQENRFSLMIGWPHRHLIRTLGHVTLGHVAYHVAYMFGPDQDITFPL